MMNDRLRLKLDDKYEIVLTQDGRFYAMRYGMDWRSLTGDNLMLALAHEVEALRQELDDAYAELHKQWPALTAVYDRHVHDRARAWYERVHGKDEP